jgi:hypothetical protein
MTEWFISAWFHVLTVAFCNQRITWFTGENSVALFNILQEGDIQIRGFKLRMPLDLQFVFTANPEDYTIAET